MLDREEYIEQAYFFRVLNERMRQNMATQDLLVALRDEVLSTTKLAMAIDFLASELKLTGGFAPAMQRLPHYFTPFQTFVIGEAESDRSRFDFRVALEILERDARYRAEGASPQGMFLFQFESLCRNRLGYDRGLEAISRDPLFDEAWQEWILTVRRQVGLVDFADLVYVRSQQYVNQRRRQQLDLDGPEKPVLFGEKEGKIAFANRQKDPLWLFAALERHLNYPTVPKPQPVDEAKNLLPGAIRRLERVESRLKLLEEEQKGGIDLARFYQPPASE
ncbi:MAG TPA: hypothetical protein VHY20_10465 [Pirellulales bacterium]|jgi:hypothetical protein|nr:hypothetical protein [Pirellulales bacterium]